VWKGRSERSEFSVGSRNCPLAGRMRVPALGLLVRSCMLLHESAVSRAWTCAAALTRAIGIVPQREVEGGPGGLHRALRPCARYPTVRGRCWSGTARARTHTNTTVHRRFSTRSSPFYIYEIMNRRYYRARRRIESGMYQSTMYDENPGIIPLLGVMRRRYLRVFRAELQTSLERESHTKPWRRSSRCRSCRSAAGP
jgi:hypothetical protein